jgi:hypothetical protein
LLAAVRSGIAVTPRTQFSIDAGIVEASGRLELPELPAAEFAVRSRPDATPAAHQLAALLAERLPARFTL